MKNFMKSIGILTAILLLVSAPYAWCGALRTNMMGGGMTTTIPSGGGNTTTTISRGGMGGGGMMGGGSRMGQFVTADLLNNDGIPEIVTIVSGRTLVIMDNEGTVLISQSLPSLPGVSNQRIMVNGLQVADMDGDGTPEIVTTYYVTNYGFMMWGGTSATAGTYLVIMSNQGELKSYKQLQFSLY